MSTSNLTIEATPLQIAAQEIVQKLNLDPQNLDLSFQQIIDQALSEASRWIKRKVRRVSRRRKGEFEEDLALNLMQDERSCDLCAIPFMGSDDLLKTLIKFPDPETLREYLAVVLEFILALVKAFA